MASRDEVRVQRKRLRSKPSQHLKYTEQEERLVKMDVASEC
jgi:hypothetical protein